MAEVGNAAYQQELDRWERETGEHRDSYPLDPDDLPVSARPLEAESDA